MKKVIVTTLISVFLIGALSGCNMSKRDQGTLLGAGLGGAAGYGLTGSGFGAAGGAIAGGFLGNQLAR